MNGIFEEGASIFEVGAITTITGIVLVFAMLLFLVFVLWLFGVVAKAATKSAEKKAMKAKAMKAKADLSKQISEEAPKTDLNEVVSSSSADDGISGEVVAAIAAAISVMYSGTGKKPVIKSVKKSGSRRSAWASAGIADNTRSF